MVIICHFLYLMLIRTTTTNAGYLDPLNDFGFVEDSMDSLVNYHSSPCTFNALSEYIGQCSKTSFDLVDSHLRLQLAVRLSVCEFEEAGVDYPSQCKYLDSSADFLDCVKQFRGSSQLWTTYSGNYRKLRSLCYEESFPQAKYHMIQLFANITKVYYSFYDSMKASYETMSARLDELDSKFQKLIKIVDQANVDKKSQFDYFYKESKEQADSMKSRYNDLESVFSSQVRSMLKETALLHINLNSVRQHTDNMASDFQYVANQISEAGSQLSSAQELQNKALLKDLQNLAYFVSDSNQFAGILVENLQQILHQSQLQVQISYENFRFFEEFIQEIHNLLELLSAFRSQALQSTSEVAAELSSINMSARTIKIILDERFSTISVMASNITEGLHQASERLRLLPSRGVLELFGEMANWSLQVLATSIIMLFGVIAAFLLFRIRNLARFSLGLISGLFIGLVLRMTYWRFISMFVTSGILLGA